MNTSPSSRKSIVVMGVSGCGKSEIGKRLAAQLGLEYVEGDDYHPPQNLAKMAAGLPLSDDDRYGWLQILQQHLRAAAAAGRAIVLTCSALKRDYRNLLRQGDAALLFVHLHGDRVLIAARMKSRTGHFMPLSLLDSQFRDLELLQADEAGIVLDIRKPPEQLLEEAVAALSTVENQTMHDRTIRYGT